MLSTIVTTHQEQLVQAMEQDHILTLNHVLYKIRINQITILQITRPVQAIQINHLHAAAIQQEHLRVVVIQRGHLHVVALTALLQAILEVHDHHLQVIRLQVVAVTAVEVLLVRAAAVVALVVREAVQVVAHQVAAEDN